MQDPLMVPCHCGVRSLHQLSHTVDKEPLLAFVTRYLWYDAVRSQVLTGANAMTNRILVGSHKTGFLGADIASRRICLLITIINNLSKEFEGVIPYFNSLAFAYIAFPSGLCRF